VRLLLGEGDSCYRQRRTGERRRKSVRGCIMNTDIQAYHLIIVKQGEQEIAGLTDADSTVPKRLGPKRANREYLEIGGVVRHRARGRRADGAPPARACLLAMAGTRGCAAVVHTYPLCMLLPPACIATPC
jgi:hypothetical protein